MQIQTAIFTTAALLLGCSGDPGPAGAGDGSGSGVFRRAVVDGVGELVCQVTVEQGMTCVDEATGDAYQCKSLPVIGGKEGVETLHCVKQAEPWTPPCDDFRQMGDGKSGLACWDPPANYCAVTNTMWMAWYCKPDGAKCCYVNALCFRCGWINMLDCRDEGADFDLDRSVCEAIRAKQPPAVAACMVDMPGPDCVLPDWGQDQGPECAIDTNLLICP